MTDWLNEHELATWKAFSLMHLQLMQRLSSSLQSQGMSMPDYLVLATLNDSPQGKRRLQDIGEELGWEKSRVSHHVNRMVDRGLVTKEPCPSDLRGHYVVITAHGVAESRRVAPGHVDDVRRNFIDHLSSSQQQQLQQLSEEILTYLHVS